ncbi:MAG TPA: sigma-70 family RNA polymerase sigma factor [Candidatus Limnocylindrales bacterium]
MTGSEDSDEALLARVAGHRDADALTALYDRHNGIAYGMALRVTGSVPIAEDVLQDAFLGAWRQASSFDPARGSGRSWLLSIVHHRAVDAVRRRRPVDPLPDSEEGASPATLVAPDIWPEVAGRLDAEAVRRALGTLSLPQREAIELAYWGGLTQTEIAERTGLPLGTVKGRMRLGLQALGRALRTDGGTAGPGDAGASAAVTQRRAGFTGDPADDVRSQALHRVLGALGRRARRLSPTAMVAATKGAVGAASHRWSVPSLAPRSLRARGDA